MPTAKTPTAIERTTSSVRILLRHRSRRTLRQRGLSMDGLLFSLAGLNILLDALLHNLRDGLLGLLRCADQLFELIRVKRHDLDSAGRRGTNSGDAGAAAQQLNLPE